MKRTIFALALSTQLFLSVPGQAGILDWFRSPEQKLTNSLQSGFEKNKQDLFDAIHPVGKATSVKIHDITIDWKGGRPSKKEKNILGFTVRYTIYWDGPIQKNGYTKVESHYDAESERWSGQILATSGITNDDVAYGVGYAAGTVIGAALSDPNGN